MLSERCSARGGTRIATALAIAGGGMIFGAALPWLNVYLLLGSSATYISAHEFASTSTMTWHALFGSSSSLVAEFAGAVGRIPNACGVGALAAAVLSVLIPVRYRIWLYRLAMSLAIVAMLDCLLVIGAVAVNDAKDADAVSTSVGCYLTLVASLAAMIVVRIGSSGEQRRQRRERGRSDGNGAAHRRVT
jgi:hypothetical protein